MLTHINRAQTIKACFGKQTRPYKHKKLYFKKERKTRQVALLFLGICFQLKLMLKSQATVFSCLRPCQNTIGRVLGNCCTNSTAVPRARNPQKQTHIKDIIFQFTRTMTKYYFCNRVKMMENCGAHIFTIKTDLYLKI